MTITHNSKRGMGVALRCAPSGQTFAGRSA